MENFPQTYEPTGSQSILEQFVGLKNFMNNKLNSNEYLKTIEQTLTEEQKAQARKNIGAGASTINVIDNLSSQSNIDALSANQGRVLNEKIDSSVQTINQSISQTTNELQQDIDANGGDIASLQGDVSELNQEIAKTLKTPMSAPNSTELVAINNTNSQVNIEIGDFLKLQNGKLYADIVYGNNVENVTDSSINTLDGYLKYFIQDFEKVCYASIGELQNSNIKNLIGKPNWYANYCTVFFIPELYVPGTQYENSTVVYKCVAIGALIGKIGIGYIRKDSDLNTSAVFCGWYSFT